MINEYLTTEEWYELTYLKDAISDYPASVHPEKQERFTELLVKSLAGKGEAVMKLQPSNY